MTLKGSKYICSGHYDRGAATCTNSKVIAATTVEWIDWSPHFLIATASLWRMIAGS